MTDTPSTIMSLFFLRPLQQLLHLDICVVTLEDRVTVPDRDHSSVRQLVTAAFPYSDVAPLICSLLSTRASVTLLFYNDSMYNFRLVASSPAKIHLLERPPSLSPQPLASSWGPHSAGQLNTNQTALKRGKTNVQLQRIFVSYFRVRVPYVTFLCRMTQVAHGPGIRSSSSSSFTYMESANICRASLLSLFHWMGGFNYIT